MKHITAKVCLVALSVFAVACGDEERFRLTAAELKFDIIAIGSISAAEQPMLIVTDFDNGTRRRPPENLERALAGRGNRMPVRLAVKRH